jgi:hypothetical protein
MTQAGPSVKGIDGFFGWFKWKYNYHNKLHIDLDAVAALVGLWSDHLDRNAVDIIGAALDIMYRLTEAEPNPLSLPDVPAPGEYRRGGYGSRLGALGIPDEAVAPFAFAFGLWLIGLSIEQIIEAKCHGLANDFIGRLARPDRREADLRTLLELIYVDVDPPS